MTNPESAPIKRDDIDTARGDDSSGGEAALTTATLSAVRPGYQSDWGPDEFGVRQYGAPMAITTSAAVIAAALREHLSDRLTYLPDRKLHALLYLAQLHAFAADDEPLFVQPIEATEQGVDVADAAAASPSDLTSTQFSIVMHVVHSYGGLAPTDLEALIRGQRPWQLARSAGASEITQESMRSWARSLDEDPHASVVGRTRSWLEATREFRTGRATAHDRPDSAQERSTFIAELRPRM